MKLYRCGYCGCPTNEHGDPLSNTASQLLSENDLKDAELTHGYCCAEQFIGTEGRVSRDMAIDAGDMSLEGQPIMYFN